jgi:membrane protein YqaA with SNARE-associated domain
LKRYGRAATFHGVSSLGPSRQADLKPTGARHSEPPPTDEQLHRYVRRSIAQAIALLVVLVVALAVAGAVWENELLAVTNWVFDTIGLVGLLLILFLSDSVLTPIPPDLVLVVLSRSWVHEYWWIAIPLIGVVSVLAGNVAWLLSTRLGQTRPVLLWLGRFRRLNRALIGRYGPWAVALAALTPVPFSIMCWTVGVLHMPWHKFGWVTLLRIPRFVGYYIAIAFANELGRWLT